MVLKYKNFVPRATREAGFFTREDYENFDAAVAAADAWIAETGVELVQIETVVLPNMFASGEKGPNDTFIYQSGDMSSHWHQFVRVWYRK